MHTSRHLHLAAVHRIIRYLLGTPDRGLFFSGNSSLKLIGYSDSNWVECVDTHRSITFWCLFIGSALISWRSKKLDRISKFFTSIALCLVPALRLFGYGVF